MMRLTVVGAGSWGSALASVLADNGHHVTLWAREAEVAEEVNRHGTNRAFLPEVAFRGEVTAMTDLGAALSEADLAVSAVPAQFVTGLWEGGIDALPRDAVVVSASKGIEIGSLRRMQEIFESLRPGGRFAAISGPSFASEVARRYPTLVVAASDDAEVARTVQALFRNRYFRVYTNPDVIGVELGGALKNVMALATGVTDGLGLGHNTRAALITRGLAEITRLGVALGARAETFAGLAGLGDLVLTCTGDLSRNRTVGYRLGRGEALDAILGEMRAVAEGVKTVRAVRHLAHREGVEMPIVEEVHAILVDGRDPRTALEQLMARDPTSEIG
ncbi:MAG: NAD(P)H-dependent glycerol-3-phosphate dehydrogenase [Longimicrobiales bacterium]|nr:NAD(P)H-dependent glycerol-3-phosphate dehydrogenase [Longimicrobiales bacterium]